MQATHTHRSLVVKSSARVARKGKTWLSAANNCLRNLRWQAAIERDSLENCQSKSLSRALLDRLVVFSSAAAVTLALKVNKSRGKRPKWSNSKLSFLNSWVWMGLCYQGTRWSQECQQCQTCVSNGPLITSLKTNVNSDQHGSLATEAAPKFRIVEKFQSSALSR